jgi:hypothetical protein
MHRTHIWLSFVATIGCAALAVYAVPRGVQAYSLVTTDDPARIANYGLAQTFDASSARTEIEAALVANDADLAMSIVELAHDRRVNVDPVLEAKANAAAANAASGLAKAKRFARGFVTGEPSDGVSLAGTLTGDLFVFGDLRDAAREGLRLARGEKADELILGLACVGIAITAGTYASGGVTAPVRAGISLVKAARRTGRLGAGLTAYLGHSLRRLAKSDEIEAVVTKASLAEPAVAIRGARQAVKTGRAGGLWQLAHDVGRVQSKAGTRAAFDVVKLAETPQDISRFARLAEKEGGKTRAIIKILGRGAILLGVASFNLAAWIFCALLTVMGFIVSVKRAAERISLHVIHRRKARRMAAFTAAAVH